MCSNIMITKESLSSFDMISDTINFLKKKTEKQLNKAKFRRNKIVKLNKSLKMMLQEVSKDCDGISTTYDVISQTRTYKENKEFTLNTHVELGRKMAHNILYLLGDLKTPYNELSDNKIEEEKKEIISNK